VAIEGSLNILRQAEKLGITRFVYISSIITVLNTSKPGITSVTDKDWNPVTREQALAPDAEPFVIYAAEKKLAEIAVWEFADSHPHIDVTSINPPFLYGPFASGFRAPEAKLASLSTNAYIYQLLQPDEPLPPGPRYTDVRDVARGCVNALTSPTSTEVGRKRILFSGDWFSFREAVEHIAEVRPELRSRLNKAAFSAPPAPQRWFDNTRAEEILGLRQTTPWRDSLVSAVDSLIKLENEWASKGLTPT